PWCRFVVGLSGGDSGIGVRVEEWQENGEKWGRNDWREKWLRDEQYQGRLAKTVPYGVISSRLLYRHLELLSKLLLVVHHIERTKKLHDEKIKNRIFNVGDQVLLFNSRLKIFSGKLKSRWSGPFTIAEIYPYGTAKLVHPDGCNFKVNRHRLKHYHGGDPPPLEIPDVHTFPKDN
nr:reverse transcriptase domain-containing protein [Tanacetum cinerariifolium]